MTLGNQAGLLTVSGAGAALVALTAWRGLTLTPGCRGRDFNHDCVLWQEEALRHLGETLSQAPPILSGATGRAGAFAP